MTERSFEVNEEGTVSPATKPKSGTVQSSADQWATWIDVDKSWDGTGSLDDHRQREFAKIKQPGFGQSGKAD